MTVKLLTEPHLKFLSIKGGCTGSPESIHVKMPRCWESQVVAQLLIETVHEISKNVVCATSKASNQPEHTCSLNRAFASRFSILHWLFERLLKHFSRQQCFNWLFKG